MTACLAKHTDGALEAAPEIDVNALRVPPRPAHLPVSGVGLLVLRFAAPYAYYDLRARLTRAAI